VQGVALCAGIGAMELGITLALGWGYRSVGYCERDAYAASVLVARMAEQTLDQAPVWDDLATFPSARYRGKVDLVSAGFPCQPWSTAGKRRGLRDPRWLWPNIWETVRALESPVVFLENVPKLRKGGLGVICADLAAAGWDAEWADIRASDLGDTHQRQRLFVLAYRDRAGLESIRRARLLHRQRATRGHDADGRGGADVADTQSVGQREPQHSTSTQPRQDPRSDTGRGNIAMADTDRASLRDEPGWSCGSEWPSSGRGCPDWDELDHSDSEGREGRNSSLAVGPDERPLGTAGPPVVFPPGPDDPLWRSVWPAVQSQGLEPSVCGMADGASYRVDRLRCVGNCVVPIVVAAALDHLLEVVT
jgi:DNA (cytosine-5)-methyltransferase 1